MGTRPEVIKLAPIIKLLTVVPTFQVITVSTGQHFSMLSQSLKVFNIFPNIHLDIMTPNQTLTGLTNKLLTRLGELCTQLKPDLIIVQGDTTSAYVGALVAFYHQIDLAHVEAGLRTFNLKSPFPEEFNRKSISIVSRYNFAATNWAKSNLIAEGIPENRIFVTGNTVVDSLLDVLNNSKPSMHLKQIFSHFDSQIPQSVKVLLTTHRRENQGVVMENIFKSIFNLLKDCPNIFVVYPMHKNPAVKTAFRNSLPRLQFFDNLLNHVPIQNNEYSYFNRILLIEPLSNSDNIHLMKKIDCIVTDSGGIQEEGVSIGKPVFILRDNTERPEGVFSGSAKLVGTNSDRIYHEVHRVLFNKTLLRTMSQPHFVYGDGTASRKIVEILNQSLLNNQKDHISHQNISRVCHNLIIILTVWKRDTLSFQLEQIYHQTILDSTSAMIIVYQNSNHINISASFLFWKSKFALRNIPLIHIHFSIETGYFGRFLSPLMTDTCSNGIFIINDDDIMFGRKYYENMVRVVNEGFLCTRNGRVIRKSNAKFVESTHSISYSRKPVTYNNDIICDFGGQIWAGKIEWLRIAWQNPPRVRLVPIEYPTSSM